MDRKHNIRAGPHNRQKNKFEKLTRAFKNEYQSFSFQLYWGTIDK